MDGICYTELYETYKLQESRCATFLDEWMTFSIDVGTRCRFIAIEWLCALCYEHELELQVVVMACSLTDRYMCKKSVLLQEFQLLVCSCIIIASKYYECELKVDRMSYMSDGSCSSASILKMEECVLKTLDYSFHFANVCVFVDLFLYCRGQIEDAKICEFLVCCCLLDVQYLSFAPSLLAECIIRFATQRCDTTQRCGPNQFEHFEKSCTVPCERFVANSYGKVMLLKDKDIFIKVVFKDCISKFSLL